MKTIFLLVEENFKPRNYHLNLWKKMLSLLTHDAKKKFRKREKQAI